MTFFYTYQHSQISLGSIFFTFANILSEKYRDSSSKKYLFLKIDAISTVHVMLHGAQNVFRRIYTYFETQKEKLIGFSCTFGSWELGHHSLPRSLLQPTDHSPLPLPAPGSPRPARRPNARVARIPRPRGTAAARRPHPHPRCDPRSVPLLAEVGNLCPPSHPPFAQVLNFRGTIEGPTEAKVWFLRFALLEEPEVLETRFLNPEGVSTISGRVIVVLRQGSKF